MKWYYWVIIALILVVFLFPKPMTKGGLGGFISEDITVHKEESKCFGISITYPASPFCSDCGSKITCHGFTHGKTCYDESYISGVISKEPKSCE